MNSNNNIIDFDEIFEISSQISYQIYYKMYGIGIIRKDFHVDLFINKLTENLVIFILEPTEENISVSQKIKACHNTCDYICSVYDNIKMEKLQNNHDPENYKIFYNTHSLIKDWNSHLI